MARSRSVSVGVFTDRAALMHAGQVLGELEKDCCQERIGRGGNASCPQGGRLKHVTRDFEVCRLDLHVSIVAKHRECLLVQFHGLK